MNPDVPIYVWQPNSVIMLIRVRSSLNNLFTGKRGSSSSAWEMVATNLRCGASAYQCKKKWENLQLKYKKIMVPPTGEGLEELPHGAHNWPYFDEMNKFMSGRHVMKPLLLIESFTPNQVASANKDKEVYKSSASSVGPSSSFSSFYFPEPSSSYSPQSSTSGTQHSLPATNVNAQVSRNRPAVSRKRVRTSSNNSATAELVATIKEEIHSQVCDREHARKNEEDLLATFKEFLSKK